MSGPVTATPRCTRAFTLIELLVVVGIIAALAALLFPVLGTVRARSRVSVCASNLGQLYRAISAYASDHDGILPPYTTSVETNPAYPELRCVDRARELVASLQPYARSREVWLCPTDPYALGTSAPPCEWPTCGLFVNHQLTSYATSDFWYGTGERAERLLRPVLGRTPLDYARWDAVDRREQGPAEIPLLTDCSAECGPDPEVTATKAPYSHEGRFHWLYFDGHVRFGYCEVRVRE